MPEKEYVVYLNGQYVSRSQAHLDIEDRGTLFADGVYDVVAFVNGRALAIGPHLERMKRSLAGIEMARWAAEGLDEVSAELIARNALTDALVYWQITRGAGRREHPFRADAAPTVLAIAYPAKPWDLDARQPVPTVKTILVEDQRWSRCDLKTLMLLPNVLAITKAKQAGCDEAILHRGATVTEGTRTSLLIVRGQELWTHPADQWILPGITRAILLELAPALGLKPVEKTFSVAQLREADEAMITGTGSRVAAVTHVDGRAIGSGQAGAATQKLYAGLMGYAKKQCGIPSA
ncbi:MAG: aminotransferase class IV [Phycisphaeraceae bacterium]|nr:aminotransferase class IV [Phycisphaeraceae bacterium]